MYAKSTQIYTKLLADIMTLERRCVWTLLRRQNAYKTSCVARLYFLYIHLCYLFKNNFFLLNSVDGCKELT